MATEGIVDHGAQVRAFADPNGRLAETEWERKCQVALRREATVVAQTTAALKAIDADTDHGDAAKSEWRKQTLANYSAAIETIDNECLAALHKVEAEAEATLSRPLSVTDPNTQVAQQRLIDLYARSMDPADLVAKFRQVVNHGEPAVAAAWAEYLPALLAARDRETHSPDKSIKLHGPMREAQALAEAFVDRAAPLRPKARATLEEVKRVRALVASHRINRAGRHMDCHPAFRTLPGHSVDSITYWGKWR